MTKLTLDPNEDNELAFSLSIQGRTSDSNSTKPVVRFVVKEASSNEAILFDNIKHENGTATVTLEANKGRFSEQKKYKGVLEVILGKHYFVATTVDLEFVEPLKVEASIVAHTNKKPLNEEAQQPQLQESTLEQQEDDLTVQGEIDSVIIKSKPAPAPKPPVIAEQKKKKPVRLATYKEMSVKERAVVNTIFMAECKKHGIDRPALQLKEGTEHTKKVLRKLVAKATRQVALKRKS